MFAADLSWQVGESVGQRKERKACERSSGTPSVRTSVTSRSSGSGSTDRQEWWTAGLNKIKAKSSKSSTKGRPVTSPSSNSQQRADPPPLQPVRETIARDFPTWELELPQHLEEHPLPRPAYTFSKTLSPTLPSGGSMDILECDVPELEGDISSRYTHSIISVSSRTQFHLVASPSKLTCIQATTIGKSERPQPKL
jgi:hypothetical protein